MPGLVPASTFYVPSGKAWMAGTSLDKPGHDGGPLSSTSNVYTLNPIMV